jgi:carboxylesterase type B
LTQSPDLLVQSGKYAKVPFIVGDQEDEGTLFGLFTSNISTTDQVSEYFNSIFFHNADKATLDDLIATYQTTTDDGSPFRTALLNNWYPQFKRIAAIIGDLTFTLTRRVFLETATSVNPGVPSWSYLASYDYGTALLGTFHGSDLLQVFYGTLPNNAASSIRGYYLSFIYDLDPNSNNTLDDWPQWSESQQLVQFNALKNNYLADDFRSDSYDYLKANIAKFYI